VRSREGRGSGKLLWWELESEERVDERLSLLYSSSMRASHFFGDQSMTMDDEDEWLRSKHRRRLFIEWRCPSRPSRSLTRRVDEVWCEGSRQDSRSPKAEVNRNGHLT
jgi:hypothetical protein